MKALHLAPALLAVALASGPAAAATFQVTRFDDPPPNGCAPLDCSLREAAIAASAGPNADTIQLGTGTYSLTNGCAFFDFDYCGDLDLDYQIVTIQGKGSEATVIRNETLPTYDSEGRLIDMLQGVLTLKGLTLEGGRVATHAAHPRGGCLFALWLNEAVLNDVAMRDCETTEGGAALIGAYDTTMTDVLVENNRASRGAGLWLAEGTHHWTRVSVRRNHAHTEGGGLLFSNGGSVIIHADADSQIVKNAAPRGGGIAIIGNAQTAGNVFDLRGDATGAGRLTPIAGNSAEQGGGIFLIGGPTLLLDGFSISDNDAYSGGGIDLSGGTLRAFDVELVQNTALRNGGGVALAGGDHELRRVTFAANATEGDGGGMFADVQNIVLENVSFAGNVASTGGALRSITKPGATRLRNASFAGNVARAGNSTAGAFVTGQFTSMASWFGDGCAGTISGPRGNGQATGTSSCGLGVYDAGYLASSAVAVSYGYYGGQFDILGFAAGSVLRNHPKGHYATCAPHDARGGPRNDGRCDIGAYETNP